MSTLKELSDIGKELGYKDEELWQFVQEEQDKEREFEHSKVMELEQLRHYSTTENSKTQVISSLKVKVTKLPYFDAKNDNMDSYLSRFEQL
ncbi:hypothetical protein DPMN_114041 [Dreissena polymorpha]|uniref:Uncharacterized protein n=1 Tax=Dreissena polymorpha TaxID=45954 RepID=A0A9D4KJF2_DREPO|nr:hypothetical protein DPMN_114041 [Dreissena polymorpha]